MAKVDYFFTAYLPALLLVIGSVLYIIGQQQGTPARRLSSRVQPKLSVAFRVLFPNGWRIPRKRPGNAGFYLEAAGIVIAAAAFLTVAAYWIWWLIQYRASH